MTASRATISAATSETACARLSCSEPAAYVCRVRFVSGREKTERLCTGHSFAFEDGLVRNPATVSGSRTPIRAAAQGRACRAA